MERTDPFDAGRLIQFALQPRTRPASEPEYRELIDAFLDRSEFRDLVQGVALGLGLEVLDYGRHGVIVGPSDNSVFAFRSAELRRGGVDDRLVDGLIHVGIAATVFPRPEDLGEDTELARPPITVAAVDATIRRLASAMEEAARSQPDPEVADITKGLGEAWRVYQSREQDRETPMGRRAANSLFRLIEAALDLYCENGLFSRDEGAEPLYQPRYAYRVRVQRGAVLRLLEAIDAVRTGALTEA